MLAPNVVLQGRYRIIRQLGKGGMGAVYEALNEPVCSIVALKETFAETEFEQQAFAREAKLLANLDHEAFPKVIDHFFESDGQYLVMEFVRGNDFSELLAVRERPFESEKALEWADQLLDALEELHLHPVIHRDIKPSNLKLTRRGKIKLLDFGIAKGTVERMTKPKTDGSLGAFTLQYAPLEQTLRASPHWGNVLSIINADETKKALANSTDPRCDIYSLGATLYHLLTCQIPIDAPTRAVAVWSGKLDPLISADKLNPQVSPALASVLLQTMSLNREERPESAKQLRHLLRKAVQNPTAAVPVVTKNAASSVAVMEDVPTQLHLKTKQLRLTPRQIEVNLTPHQSLAANSQLAVQIQQFEEKSKPLFNEELQDKTVKEPLVEATLQRAAAENAGFEQAVEEVQTHNIVAETEDGKIKLTENKKDLIDVLALRSQTQVIQTYRLVKKQWRCRRLWVGSIAVILGLIAGLSIWQAVDFGKPQMVEGSVKDETPTLSPIAPENFVAADSELTSKIIAPEKSVDSFVPQKMALVSAGSFVMGQIGRGDVAERPAHKVTVKPFYMDVYEVTNEEYAAFVKTMGRQNPPNLSSRTKIYEAGKEKFPVTGVSWADANEYCQHFGKRLPNEEEWEFAARGTDGRIYPWGDKWQSGMANADRINNSLTEVGKSRGTSPFGIYDMSGNAWEWTASVMKPYPGGKMPPNQPKGKLRVIRGGTYDSSKQYATTTYRTGWAESGAATYSQTGFRCVQDDNN